MRMTQSEIQEALNHYMRIRKVTGRQLAAALGVSENAVSKWRTGKNSLSAIYIPEICRYLNVSPSEFFEYDGPILLSASEMALVRNYRKLDENGKDFIEDVVASFVHFHSQVIDSSPEMNLGDRHV